VLQHGLLPGCMMLSNAAHSLSRTMSFMCAAAKTDTGSAIVSWLLKD
jgi:hypothetical protein